METNIVFDVSAVLALFFNESGAKEAIDKLPYTILHTVNLCEVSTVLQYKGMPRDIAEQKLRELFPIVIPMTTELAFLTASLHVRIKCYGLSLGDRAWYTRLVEAQNFRPPVDAPMPHQTRILQERQKQQEGQLKTL